MPCRTLTFFLTRIVRLKEVHFLLQEGVKQQVLQPPVQSGQGALKDASSQSREQSAVGTDTSTATYWSYHTNLISQEIFFQ